MHSDTRQRGLTLVELLVAISILAFVAVIGWRGLDTIVRARLALNADLENTRGMQLAFAQLQNDCNQLVSQDMIPGRTILAVTQGRLRLVRLAFLEAQPTKLQVVTYAVENGVLTRRESLPTRDLQQLDQMWAVASQANDAAGAAIALQSGVTSMGMRLWASDNKGWRDAESAASPTVSSEIAQRIAARAGLGGAAAAAAAAVTGQRNTGLEVSLQLQGAGGSMQKVLLLGAV